ncbi:hypothetical protein B0I35DRAFT_403405 [Stachybotrys elegans]|uniref:Uncharacterized protein n=1 Tax=Stachybotrys elegans TaxID=80388 RepID=A0A8K0WX01_9HYPO|nr:hypothetical protein B0I35DRAFT_403405 [Stachybotrys elegans]
MAMDALRNLVNNIPTWQTRLNELSSQIDQRQAELAAVAAAEGKNPETRSLRNQGSTESLKPKDDGPLHGPQTLELDALLDANGTLEKQPAPQTKPSTPPQDPTRAPGSASPTRLHKQGREAQAAAAAAHSRAAAQAKKTKRRSASMISAEGITSAYRTRSMIIVYYDSYVQGFFDDLVRFVASSRNLMRKAKMAAKVAQIKRLAELEMPDDENGGEEKAMDMLPSLRYMSTRRLGPSRVLGGQPGGNDQPQDVYDKLDRALEAVQGTCEHGAHQFLRDADCNEELKKIQTRIAEAFEMAKQEMERVEREEPELAKESGDAGKIRTRRPISMRRELSASQKEDLASREVSKIEVIKPEPPKNSVVERTSRIEADTMEVDTSPEIDQELPVLNYRSTRHMRMRAAQMS